MPDTALSDAESDERPVPALQEGLETAQAALAAGDLAAALAVWSDLRADFPDSVLPFQRAAAALLDNFHFGEAEVLLEVAMERFPDEPSLLVDHAWVAHRRRDLAEALRRWNHLRSAFPDHPTGYTGTVATLRDAGRVEEAEALLNAARERFPTDSALLMELARIAQTKRDWPEAIQRWTVLRKQFPDFWPGFVGGAAALRESGNYDEADALLAGAMARFPHEAAPVIEYARVASSRRDWPEALRRWEIVTERFPNRADTYAGHAAALRESGLFDAADAVLTEAMAHFPGNPALVVDHAWVAHGKQDWPEAAHRWNEVRHRFPEHVAGFTNGAVALRGADRPEEADDVLADARRRFPDALEVAALASEWGAAVAEAVNPPQAPPDPPPRPPEAINLPVAELAAAAKPDPVRQDPALRDFVLRFESLGGLPLGSELGLVQRACGAEPLSLLRWADIDIETLVSLLEQRFEDVGDADATELVALPTSDGRQEYCTLYRRGTMAIRTFVDATAMPPDQMLTAACQRLQFLARRLVEGLSRGDRIFVYRQAGRVLTQEQTTRLHAAVRAYGDATLLILRLADADHPAGSVVQVEPGLLIGAMDGFAVSASGQIGEPPIEAWLMVLGNANALWTPPAPAPELPKPEMRHEPAQTPEPATPAIAKPAEIKIAVIGYHLAHQVTMILTRLPALRGRIAIHRLDVGSNVDGIRARLPERWVETADIHFEEAMVGAAEVKQGIRALLPAHCEVRTFPTPSIGALWPFRGRDDRLVPEPPIYNGGRYSNTDPIAASLAHLNMTDDALFDAYMELTETAPIDLDAMFAGDVARWEADDLKLDVKLASFIQSNIREKRLFTTPNERGADIIRQIVSQLFATPKLQDAVDIATLRESLEYLTRGWLASHHELPVHPRVARHFGLAWWSPDKRYRMMENRFTFRDYIIRYIRWSPWLV